MTCALPATAAPLRMPRSGWFRSSLRPPILSLSIILAGSASSAQKAPPAWPAIAALFGERCVMCHAGEHAAAKLHLDSYKGTVAGSKNGPVLVSGEASTSELIRRVRGESQPRMPFLSYPLSADEIALIEHWIEAGLPESEAAAATKPLPRPAAVPDLAEETTR